MKLKRFHVFFCLLVVLIMSCAQPCLAEEVRQRITFFTFDVKNADQYAILRDTITQRIVSRLAERSDVSYVESNLDGDEEQALVRQYPLDIDPYFERLATDWAGNGKLVLRNDRLFIEARFYSVDASPSVIITAAADDESKIWDAIDDFLTQMDNKLFNRAQNKLWGGGVASGGDGMEGFRTEHPDKAYRQQL